MSAPEREPFHVVILAAGLGSRLGTLTERVPKALIPVGGQPLILHAIGFAQRLRPAEIVVVGGYGFRLLALEIARHPAPVTLIENKSFRDGNLVSLMAARSHVRNGFLVMNVDHIYRPAIADLAAPAVDAVTAFIDTDRVLGADDMKIERDEGGRVRSIAKTLSTFDAGYVGMTRVPPGALTRYWAAAESTLAAEGRASHVERILARLAVTGDPPHCRDISGHGWLEVDLAQERDRADEALRAGGWT